MREWLAIFVVAGAAAAAAIATARGCGAGGTPPRPTPFAALPPPLPRIGTVGDYPPAEETLVLEAESDGSLRADGRPVGLGDFRRVLRAKADSSRGPRPSRLSRIHVVLRLHRALPWTAAQWLMQECAAPDVRVHRVYFAALPEDGSEEGAVAAYLPTEASDLRSLAVLVASVRLLPAGEGTANFPADLASAYVSPTYFPKGASVRLEADPSLPVGRVLEALDLALRAGHRTILFRGTVGVPGTDLRGALAAIPRTDGRVAYRIGGRSLIPFPPDETMPGPAPVPRVRGRLAGSFLPGTDPKIPARMPR